MVSIPFFSKHSESVGAIKKRKKGCVGRLGVKFDARENSTMEAKLFFSECQKMMARPEVRNYEALLVEESGAMSTLFAEEALLKLGISLSDLLETRGVRIFEQKVVIEEPRRFFFLNQAHPWTASAKDLPFKTSKCVQLFCPLHQISSQDSLPIFLGQSHTDASSYRFGWISEREMSERSFHFGKYELGDCSVHSAWLLNSYTQNMREKESRALLLTIVDVDAPLSSHKLWRTAAPYFQLLKGYAQDEILSKKDPNFPIAYADPSVFGDVPDFLEDFL